MEGYDINGYISTYCKQVERVGFGGLYMRCGPKVWILNGWYYINAGKESYCFKLRFNGRNAIQSYEYLPY